MVIPIPESTLSFLLLYVKNFSIVHFIFLLTKNGILIHSTHQAHLVSTSVCNQSSLQGLPIAGGSMSPKIFYIWKGGHLFDILRAE